MISASHQGYTRQEPFKPAPFAVGYQGVLVSTSAQPGWRDARWLGGYLTCGALVLGSATLIVLAYMLGEAHAAERLRPALGVLLLLHSAISIMLLVELRP